MQERQEEPSDCIAAVTPTEGERERRRPGGKTIRLQPSYKKCSARLKGKP